MDNKSLQKFEEIRSFLRDFYSQNVSKEYKEENSPLEKLSQIPVFSNQFFYVMDLSIADISYVHPNIQTVLGYEASEINLSKLYSVIHPEDLAIVLEGADAGYHFISQHKIEPLVDYYCIDYRIKTMAGNYIRIFRVNTTLKNDYKSIYHLSFCTDITKLKDSDKIEVRAIGPNTAKFSEYFSVEKFYGEEGKLSERETEILRCIVEGMSSEQIGKILYISKNTVDTHRRNILHKTQTTSTPELISYAFKHHLVG
jgi:DNA-binding CsgD family transcriptional regulator